jgi:hypothetical protein
MWRKLLTAGLIGLVLSATPAFADPASRTAGASKSAASSGSKRALWTAVGIGAGFAAGMFIGLNAFDDAVNSDRKVWTSALVGAAAGGLAGNLIGKATARTTPVRADSVLNRREVSAPWTVATGPDDELRRRVRKLNAFDLPGK